MPQLGRTVAAVALGALLSVSSPWSAQAAPQNTAPQTSVAPVASIAQPCPAQHPWPDKATRGERKAQLERNTGIALKGPGWTNPKYVEQVKIVWQTLDALSCTPYLDVVKASKPGFGLYAGPTRSWSWGDWGLTHPGLVTLDFAKWQGALTAKDPGRLTRILVHEIGHVWSKAPASAATYAAFAKPYRALGNFGPYAYSKNENFSEVIGYYVARCAQDNPYDQARYAPYYEFVKTRVFAGREFGPAPGKPASCAPPAPRPTPKPEAPEPTAPGPSVPPGLAVPTHFPVARPQPSTPTGLPTLDLGRPMKPLP